MRMMLALAALAALTVPAQAQYYAPPPPPPPGYYPPPGYRSEYPRPEYPQYGRHCEAFMRTQYGPQRLFCRIVEPKPLGMECACPPPPPPPGYAPGPFVGGRTVR